MTKKELVELLKSYPDNAIIYAISDHGQMSEQSEGILVSKDEVIPYKDFDEEIAWRSSATVKNKAAVTAICI